MAKKSKRRSQARMRTPAPRPAVATTVERPARIAAAERPAKAAPAEQAPAHNPAEIANEYRYVYGDLKRIGILAAVMLALLVTLALLAQYVF